MAALWPNTFVEETNLTFTMSALRKTLGDGQNGEQFIQTVPTRGYRFVAPVTAVNNQPVGGVTLEPAPRARWHVRPVAILGVLLGVTALAIAVFSQWRGRAAIPTPVRLAIPCRTPHWPPMRHRSRRSRPTANVWPSLSLAGSRIWLRDIDGQHAQPVAGTDNASGLFWAPDSQHLAFTTPVSLKTLKLSDGAIQTLCEPCQPAGGGTWSRTGADLVSLDGRRGVRDSRDGRATRGCHRRRSNSGGDRAHRAALLTSRQQILGRRPECRAEP